MEEAWDKEVARRMKDLEAGRAVTVPWEELRLQLLASMSASRVEYHEGAAADVRMPSLGMKNENLKLPWTSSRNSIAPHRQSEKRQNVGRLEATTSADSCCGDFHLPSSIRTRKM